MTQTFETGATRNDSTEKLDFEGFLSPLALEALAAYMNFHRHLEDGTLRASDNWQKGIPLTSYIKSLWRHFFDAWRAHRGGASQEDLVFALCGILFNTQGYLHELLKGDYALLAGALGRAEVIRKVARENAASWAAVEERRQKRSQTTLPAQVLNQPPQ